MGKQRIPLIFEAMQSLNASDRKEWLLFLESPFYNSNPTLVTVANYVGQCIQRQIVPDESALKALLPTGGKTPADQLLNIANNQLLSLFEQFLAARELKNSPEQEKLAASRFYRKNGLDRHFRTNMRKMQNLLTTIPQNNGSALEFHHLTEWEQYQFEVANNRSTNLNIQALSDSMDLSFMANKLKLACLAISHQAIYKTNYHLDYLDETLLKLKDNPQLTEIPALGLYFHCYLFLIREEDGAGHFLQFRDLLDQVSGQLNPEEMRVLYLLAINYGIRQLNRSVSGALETTLGLYKGALRHRLLLENGNISRFAFSNIVALALKAGETDWVASFIQDYSPLIERNWRDATASLCRARLEYEKRQLPEALQWLQRADYKDTMNNLTAKVLQMKIFYELDEIEILESHLKNMKNYIRRHAAIGYHRTNYTNIVHFTEQLLSLNRYDRSAVIKLLKSIEKEEVLTEKEWILKQTKRLIP